MGLRSRGSVQSYFYLFEGLGINSRDGNASAGSRLPRELPARMIPARIADETLKLFFGGVITGAPRLDVMLLLERARAGDALARDDLIAPSNRTRAPDVTLEALELARGRHGLEPSVDRSDNASISAGDPIFVFAAAL
jgi:hypothetical protein